MESDQKTKIVLIGGVSSFWFQYRNLAAIIRKISNCDVRIAQLTPFSWIGQPNQKIQSIVRKIDYAISNGGGADRLILIGHSLGGLMACLYQSTDFEGHLRFRFQNAFQVQAISLGTPFWCIEHIPIVSGWIALVSTYDLKSTPGSGNTLMTVAGASTRGDRKGKVPERISFQSYSALAGDGEAIGDGLVPTNCATLPFAHPNELVDVTHGISTGGDWYGKNEATVRRWWQGPCIE
ncbi:MAG TPA: hypothetical protein PKD55_09195 [Bellilinea sp.]|nr:hypothetical protein [Bellilinea sp.]